MWRIQAEGMLIFGQFLQDCRAKADEDCNTVLLSGEDFENAIADLTLASDIEAQAREAGFDEVNWVVVSRDKHDYAASIYAEMSKHNIVLQQSVVTQALEQRGCLYAATHNFNYIFVLDLARFRQRFKASIKGELWEYSMKDFLAERPGSILLKRLMGQSRYEEFETSAEFCSDVANKRLSSPEVERNYLSTAMGLTPRRQRKLPWCLLMPRLIKMRQ